MLKRVGIVVAILIAALLTALIFQFRPLHEPSYKGKRLHYWVDPWVDGGQESPEEVTAALNAMQNRAIPYLIEKLQWKPSPTMLKLYERFPRFPLFMRYVQGASNPRGPAAHALGQFGPLATNAIPQLLILSRNSDLPSSWYERGCAQAALIKIRQEPLTPYIEKLKDTADLMAWYQNAMMIGQFGAAGTNAIPNLVCALNPTNHPVIQAHALIALGMIHSHPEVCVPEIVPFLRSPDVALRQKAVYALGQFRGGAKPAWAELLVCLQDSDPWTRQDAGRVLKAIDPEAATKAGIK
jgi:HEAT repeat protein